VTQPSRADRPRRRRRDRCVQGGSSCCACSPRPGTTSRSSPPRPRCVRRRAHLGGAVGQPGRRRGLDDVRRGAARAARPQADLVVVAPATADLLARAAHGLADDLLTNTCSPRAARCVRAGDAHRDVGAPGHRRQRRDPAPPRCRRARPRGRPADRRRHRPGPAARARRDLRGRLSCEGCCGLPAALPFDLAGRTSSSPPAAPASRSTRCASSATGRRASRATRWPGRRRARGAR
jgi:hypothetical protein